jgi:hypothetical protein
MGEWYRYKNSVGQEFRVGSMTQLASLTGIAKSAMENLFRRDELNEWTEINRKTFIKLAALLNQMEPPLVDPLDPLKRELRFPGFEVEINGEIEVFEGWEQLAHLHSAFAPDAESFLPDNLKPVQSKSQPKLKNELSELLNEASPEVKKKIEKLLLNERSSPQASNFSAQVETQLPVIESPKSRPINRKKAMKISKLSSLISEDMMNAGIFSAEEYVDLLLEERRNFWGLTEESGEYFDYSEEVKKESIDGIKLILFENTLPTVYPTLNLLILSLKDEDGEVFASLDKLLNFCGLSESHTSENSKTHIISN